MRNKKLILGLGLGVVFLASATIIAGYYYGRDYLPKLPELLKTQLAQNQITLDYKSVEIPDSGLEIRFNNVQIDGPTLPYYVATESMLIRAGFRLGIPFFKLRVEVIKPLIAENEDFVSSKAPDSSPPPAAAQLPKGAGLFLAMAHFEAYLEDANVETFDIEHLTGELHLGKLKSTDGKVSGGNVDYDVTIKKIGLLPWLSNLGFSGSAKMDNQIIRADGNRLNVGPMVINLSGAVALKNKQWQLNLQIPETDLGKRSDSIDFNAIEGMKSVAGILGINIQAKGLGSDLKNVVAEGNILARNIKAQLKHPNLEGAFILDGNTEFKKSKQLSLNGNLKIDLTQAKLSYEDLFTKPSGTPLKASASFNGNEDKLIVKSAKVRFHNLESKIGATLALKPELNGKIRVDIPSTNLAKWEQFFPQYSQSKTGGSFIADVSYEGPLKKWAKANILGKIQLNQVRFPVLSTWLPKNGFKVSGLASIDSRTNWQLSKGAIKKLSTDTSMDLTQTKMTYEDKFSKKQGIPAKLKMRIISSDKRAQIKVGTLTLAETRANLTGSINNFENPQIDIKLSAPRLEAEKIIPLLPSALPHGLTNLQASVALNTSLKGPILHKIDRPLVSGKLTVRKMKFDYKMHSSSQQIRLRRLNGPIYFTNQSISAPKLFVNFPKTNGYLKFKLSNFESPKLNFSLQAKQFSIGDFYDERVAKEAGPVTVVAVPMKTNRKQVQQAQRKQEDFRQNEFIKKATINGEIKIRYANLGWTKAENVFAKIGFKDLNLKIDPFQMNTMGGGISAKTKWNGKPNTPLSQFKMEVTNVDANAFISSWSPKGKDLIYGKLDNKIELTFKGMSAEEAKESLAGFGNYRLKDGKFKTLRFTQKPMEALRKIPGLANRIQKTSWNESIRNATGKFKIQDGKIILENVNINAGVFDLTSNRAAIGFDQSLSASFKLLPKSNMFSRDILNALKDSSGKPMIPLNVGGSLQSPAVGVPANFVNSKLSSLLTQQLKSNPEIKKATKKIESELKKSLKGLFK